MPCTKILATIYSSLHQLLKTARGGVNLCFHVWSCSGAQVKAGSSHSARFEYQILGALVLSWSGLGRRDRVRGGRAGSDRS